MDFRIFILQLLSNLRSRQYSAVSKVSHRNSTPVCTPYAGYKCGDTLLPPPAPSLPSLSLGACRYFARVIRCQNPSSMKQTSERRGREGGREGQAACTVFLSFLPPIPSSRLLVSLMRPRRKGNKTLRISYGCLVGFSHRADNEAHISGLWIDLGSYYGMKLSNWTATRPPRYRPY